MLEKLLSSASTERLKQGLDAAWLRNDVIAQNIANVDTPGYRRKEVLFEEYLDSEMKTGKLSHGESRLNGAGTGMTVREDPVTESYRVDGNNVDVEREMALMAMNSIKYSTMVQRLTGSYSTLKSVIAGGK